MRCATYEQLMNLSLEEFNAREDKSIQELLLYLYQKNKVDGLKNFVAHTKEIYKAFLDTDEIEQSILSAVDELIEEADCEDCRESLIGFKEEFAERCEEVEENNPLYYFGDWKETMNAFVESLAHYFGAFDVLEDWEYDFSKLLYPKTKE